MPDSRDAGIPPEEVERRLEELRALYTFGIALMSARFLDGTSAVRDGPAPRWDPPKTGEQTEPPKSSEPS